MTRLVTCILIGVMTLGSLPAMAESAKQSPETRTGDRIHTLDSNSPLTHPRAMQLQQTTDATADVSKTTVNTKEKEAFDQANDVSWEQVFSDEGTGDWQEQWFLDGEVGQVSNGPDGMTLTAGSEFKNDAHHMVLWTKDDFEGDLKIEYDYTRRDNEKRCVNILYIQATGSGQGEFAEDITEWSELRKVPAMRTYYDNMNLYHISYAAFGGRNNASGQSYIRGRRYMPHKTGLRGTNMKPDYFTKTLFAPGVQHHMTFIKKDRDILVRVENPDEVYYAHLKNQNLPTISEGRIGLRHMFTRSATYKNFKVSKPAKEAE